MAITGGMNEHRECVYCKSPWYKTERIVAISDQKKDATGAPLPIKNKIRFTCDRCGQDVFEVEVD